LTANIPARGVLADADLTPHDPLSSLPSRLESVARSIVIASHRTAPISLSSSILRHKVLVTHLLKGPRGHLYWHSDSEPPPFRFRICSLALPTDLLTLPYQIRSP